MEIEAKDGSKTVLKEGVKREFGRGLGFDSNDRTASHRHVSFQLRTSDLKDEARVCFAVIGKNPIWVFNNRTGEIRVYRRFESGEMEDGDMFCLSAKIPVWFNLKRIDLEGEAEDKDRLKRDLGFENELTESLRSSLGFRAVAEVELDSIDVSHIDPVKEFGFVVMGQEFDGYPKNMIRDIKYWDWFLEEPREDSEDDEVRGEKRKKGERRKRKKGEVNDYDWTGESEDDKEPITTLRNVQRPKYSTRSKDHDTSIKDTTSKNSKQKTTCANEKDIDDEDDDTLGGFIVDDEDVGQEVASDEDEEEEEEEEDYDDDIEEEE